MELTETVESINQQLRDIFGIDTASNLPIWRVCFSEDQYERRFGTYDDYTPSGLYIRTVTEVRIVPKYKQWIHEKYILERLVVVPEFNRDELVGAKVSYEPMWTFEDKDGNFLPPKFIACKFIIDSVLAAQAVCKTMITGDEQRDRPTLARYKEGLTAENCREEHEKRIKELELELFGDESGLMGTTFDSGPSIIVPQTIKGDS